MTSFGLMIKAHSKSSQLSRNEGLMFTFYNIAWVIGPLLAGFISNSFGINSIFILAAFFMLLSFVIIKFANVVDNRKQKKTDENLIKNFKEFFKKHT